MKYRAYLNDEGISSSTDTFDGHLYTDDPYDQPEKFHRAIALLEAAADGDYVELANIGTRHHHPLYNEVDYFIDEEYLEGETS